MALSNTTDPTTEPPMVTGVVAVAPAPSTMASDNAPAEGEICSARCPSKRYCRDPSLLICTGSGGALDSVETAPCPVIAAAARRTNKISDSNGAGAGVAGAGLSVTSCVEVAERNLAAAMVFDASCGGVVTGFELLLGFSSTTATVTAKAAGLLADRESAAAFGVTTVRFVGFAAGPGESASSTEAVALLGVRASLTRSVDLAPRFLRVEAGVAGVACSDDTEEPSVSEPVLLAAVLGFLAVLVEGAVFEGLAEVPPFEVGSARATPWPVVIATPRPNVTAPMPSHR